jgi:hypothetical protein
MAIMSERKRVAMVQLGLAEGERLCYSSVPALLSTVRSVGVMKRDALQNEKEGVDELHETPYDLASLLLTNTTLRQTNPAGSLKINSR